jgi:FKBP-type peptidyl-prolyl cis-trans isomerase FklB
MKHTLIAASLFGLWYGVSAVAAPADAKDAPPAAATGQATAANQTAAEAQAETPPGAAAAEIQSDADKVNYSLGYELGQDLARDSMELAPEALIKGARDGISGAKPAVKTSERREILGSIKAQRGQENLEKSQAFLTANGQKEGVKTLPSGLQYKELRAGEGKTPNTASKVTVNYRGTLMDGSEFDSSYARDKPATFEVKRVIKGWREALLLMKEGAKWELYVPPELGYGKAGRDKRIPPNSALIYEVELLSVEQMPTRPPEGAKGPQGPRQIPGAGPQGLIEDDE